MFTRKIGSGLITLTTLLLSAATASAEGPNLGQPISQADLAPWDLTVMPDGTGLPPGSGPQRRARHYSPTTAPFAMVMKEGVESSRPLW
jgi:hypothetical protein